MSFNSVKQLKMRVQGVKKFFFCFTPQAYCTFDPKAQKNNQLPPIHPAKHIFPFTGTMCVCVYVFMPARSKKRLGIRVREEQAGKLFMLVNTKARKGRLTSLFKLKMMCDESVLELITSPLSNKSLHPLLYFTVV